MTDASAPGGDSTEGVRLQKVLAAAGVASRRVSEQLIVEGRVEVNGRIVTELGSRIDPATDLVAVDGVAVQLDPAKRYYMLNKPRGVVSSMRDEQGRPDLTRFTEGLEERVFNVGRLDAETSGLLLLTNDGDLAHVLAHPSFGVEKTYIAKVRGRVTPQVVQQLKRGVELEDGIIVADRARVLQQQGDDRALDGGADPALGAQPHRAAHARCRGASGRRARAAQLRAPQPRDPPIGRHARVD